MIVGCPVVDAPGSHDGVLLQLGKPPTKNIIAEASLRFLCVKNAPKSCDGRICNGHLTHRQY
ncbi:MAG: hypothetical protein BWY92_01321 [Firmicutes bacterium ADurb.BinA052]|nr:MAG: hypothetical protein BWY92_01321 [Firmicutes bacterium ADurb.BinA052]